MTTREGDKHAVIALFFLERERGCARKRFAAPRLKKKANHSVLVLLSSA